MSPQRVADAASISPYPFVVRQERQPPPQPPPQPPAAQSTAHESARPMKGKKKPKPPRPVEEEIRFNTGPRTLRAPAPARAPRRAFRFGRAGPEDERGIPDYPPPSFQEAISTPPLSVSPSTVSLIPPAAPRPVPDVPALPPQDPEPPTTAAAGPDPGGPAETDDTASISDESIFIIERNTVPFSSTDLPSGAELTRRVHRDWLSRRGVEFPGHAPSQQEAVVLGNNRGHAAAQVKPPLLALDTGTKLDLHEGVSPPPPSPKRRFLTLSPLRTMFPPKSPVHEARAMSAHPAPGGSASPYAASRSTFFRSTSSLATSLLPLLPAHKSGSLSRRIFAHRGKVKPLGPPELLDAWEVLEQETYQGVDFDGATHPASLMSAIAAMRPLVDVGASPTRSQSFTFGAQPHTAPASTRAHHQYTLSQEFGIDGTTASAARDWKGPSTAFIDRPLNRRTGASPSMLSVVPVTATLPNAGTSVIDLPLAPSSASGLLEPVRLRPASASPAPSLAYKRTAHVVHASPLRVEAQPRILIGNPEAGTALYQRALETPLPVTPLLRTEFDDATNRGYGPGADVRSDIDAPFLSRTSPQLSLAVHHRLATVASASAINLLDEPMTPTRHHYAGRPLPRPPSTTRVGAPESSTAQAPSCPEGLLIDLDDTTLDDSPSGASTPRSEYSRGGLFPPRPAMSQSTSSVDLVGDTAQPTHDMFSDLTDLDLLVAGLSERPQDGSDYDTLLLLSELIGPASPPRGTGLGPGRPRVPCPVATGRIEVARRRTTTAGRVKVKLTLLGVRVDTCGACLAQFRGGDAAAAAARCGHAFHAACYERWRARASTCPLCRAPLVDDTS